MAMAGRDSIALGSRCLAAGCSASTKPATGISSAPWSWTKRRESNGSSVRTSSRSGFSDTPPDSNVHRRRSSEPPGSFTSRRAVSRHDDHFHLRVGCGPTERRLGCREQAPHWPWQSDPARKADSSASAALSDASIVRWLFAEEHLNEGSDIAGRRLDSAAKPSSIAVR